MAINWYKYSSPAAFYPFAGKLIPWFGWGAAILTVIGLVIGLGIAPTDFQQGEVYRIIFIHVPSAWMSMFIYLVMAFWGAMALAFNTRLSSMMAQSLAPTGALMTLPDVPFQVRRAFLASSTTLAMSSSLYTPLTPEMADSFMPCFRPSL